MIGLIRFELKKFVFRKRNLFLLIAATVLFLALLYHSEGGYLFINRLDQNRTDFFSSLGNAYTDAEKEQLESEAEALEGRLYRSTEEDGTLLDEEEAALPEKYGETLWADFIYLNDALDCIEANEQRNDSIRSIIEMNGDSVNSDYTEENNHYMADRDQLYAVAKSLYAGWPACILVLLIFAFSFCVDTENHCSRLLAVTKTGDTAIYTSKILTGILVTAVLDLYFFLLFGAAQFILTGNWIKLLNCPLFLVEGFELCASGLKVWHLLLAAAGGCFLLSLLCVFLAMLLSLFLKKRVLAALASFAVFLIGAAAELLNMAIYENDFIVNTDRWYLISQVNFTRIMNRMKEFNPFALINASWYLEQPQYLTVGNWMYPIYVVPMLIIVAFVSICAISILQTARR